MKQVSLIFLLLAIIPVSRASISAQDFAYLAELQTDGKTPYYEMEIPAVVYEQISRDDLGDIRVLNAAGEVVPHAIRKQRNTRSRTYKDFSAAFYPLYQQQEKDQSSDFHLNIRRSAEGEVIDITSKPLNPEDKDKPDPVITGYLLDTKGWAYSTETLRLRWALQSEQSFISKVTLHVSDDMNHWRQVSRQQTIASLEYPGQERLVRNEIRLPHIKSRFIRLDIQGEHPPIKINVFELIYRKSIEQLARQWVSVSIKKTSDAGVYAFSHRLNLPIRALEVSLPQNNTVVHARVYSYKQSQDKWWSRGRARLYRMTIDDVELEQKTISLSPSTDKKWELRIDQQGGGIGEGLPEVRVGWQPQQLVFVARGEAPFQLAWGSARVKPSAYRLGELLVGKKDSPGFIGKAVFQAETLRPMNVKMLEPAAIPIDWKQWILWIILIGAAILLIWMAARLMKKMSEPAP